MPAINLNTLKENIQVLFEAANTTTASTDLSNGLTRRVQRVLKVNPGFIPLQASFYPLVTTFIDSIDMEDATIARTQATGRRKADVDVKIVGLVMNTTIAKGTEDADQADESTELLMRNIEDIMRDNPTVSGVATWSQPTGVTYHTIQYSEEAHMRAGVMNYRVRFFY